MNRWEYKRVRSTWNSKAKSWMVADLSEQEILNQLGRQGWEMIFYQDCVVSNLFGTITDQWHSFMFKRNILEHAALDG